MDRYEEAALDAANEVLAELAAPPAEALEPGRRGAWQCPIAATIRTGSRRINVECQATPQEIRVFDELGLDVLRVAPSSDAATFMRRFDEHKYTHLEGAA